MQHLDIEKRFQEWALGWFEPSNCSRLMWYMSWSRTDRGELLLTTEFGPVVTRWYSSLSNQSDSNRFLSFLASFENGNPFEAARLQFDEIGQVWHIRPNRRFPWKRNLHGGWDDFGFVALLANVCSAQQGKGLKSTKPRILKCMEGIPAIMEIRQQ